MTRPCAQCGREFKAIGNAKTCSPDCSKARHREWRKDPVNRQREREREREWRKDPVNRQREREWMREWMRKKASDRTISKIQNLSQFLNQMPKAA